VNRNVHLTLAQAVLKGDKMDDSYATRDVGRVRDPAVVTKRAEVTVAALVRGGRVDAASCRRRSREAVAPCGRARESGCPSFETYLEEPPPAMR